jgi:hypothetical protein
MATEPIFLSDGEVDPISHEPRPAPKVPRHPEGEPAGPLVDMVIFVFATAGTIALVYGVVQALSAAYRLARSLL